MIKAMKKASGNKIPYEIRPKRVVDIGSVYADASLAGVEMGWAATRSL
jgi:UDP-glucose 4-epimerase